LKASARSAPIPPPVEQLERTAAQDPQRFNHTAHRIRDDRRGAAESAAMTAELVLYYDYKGPIAPVDDLRTADRESLTIADANGACIGHTKTS
jgi:ParB family chromosome partitioning protein